MKATKKSFIYSAKANSDWWKTHVMAPAPIRLNQDTIRIFCGCWSEQKISRIGYIDVDATNPSIVKGISKKFVLDIGEPGCFDDNGVFPGHVYNFGDGKIYLYYTGFQLSDKVPFFNFGGLAISADNGMTFSRHSKAPVLDRADEGLLTRAGQSIEVNPLGGFHSVYSAGGGWFFCNGKDRPIYEVFYQETPDGISMNKSGRKIVSCDFSVEHGLGRPQIINLGEYYYVFYTRRIISDMKYFMGCSRSLDCKTWERFDSVFDGIPFGEKGAFDDQMMYFPAVLRVSEHKAFCFYCGNHYGEEGIGYLELDF